MEVYPRDRLWGMEAVHLGERILLRISDLVHYEECYKMKEGYICSN